MRRFPIVERVLVGAFALVVLAVAGFALIWHLRLRAIAADPPPRPGAPPAYPPGPATPEAVMADYLAWNQRMHEGGLIAHFEASGTLPTPFAAQGRVPDPELIAMADALARLLARGLRFERDPLPHAERPIDGWEAYAGLEPVAWEWLAEASDHARAPEALADLDALVGALQEPRGQTEYQWRQFAGWRDQAYVLAALAGTAPPDAWQRLRAARVDAIDLLVWQLEGERREKRQAAAAEYAAGPWALARNRAYMGRVRWKRFWQVDLPDWWGDYADQVRQEAFAARQEDDVIQRRTQAEDDPWMCHPNIDGPRIAPEGYAALHVQFQHRLALLALEVLAARDATGGLPEHLPDMDLAAGPDRLALVVTHEAHRFTIAPAPDAVQRPYLVVDWNQYRTPDPIAGPYWLDEHAVAIDLAAPEVRHLGEATAAATAGDQPGVERVGGVVGSGG